MGVFLKKVDLPGIKIVDLYTFEAGRIYNSGGTWTPLKRGFYLRDFFVELLFKLNYCSTIN